MDLFGKKNIQTLEESVQTLEELVKHLKADKIAMRQEFFRLLRIRLDQEAGATINFLNRSERLSREPYMFVNSKGKILGYTPALEVALGIKKNIRGTHYIELFSSKDNSSEVKGSLEKYFSSTGEINVEYEKKEGKKTRQLIITKEKPVYIEGIELGLFKPEKKIRAVAFVPIRVSSQKQTLSSLVGKDAKQREAHLNKVKINLIVDHGWSNQEIDRYVVDNGELGLINKYKELKEGSK